MSKEEKEPKFRASWLPSEEDLEVPDLDNLSSDDEEEDEVDETQEEDLEAKEDDKPSEEPEEEKEDEAEVDYRALYEEERKKSSGVLADLRQVRSDFRAERAEAAAARQRMEDRLDELQGVLKKPDEGDTPPDKEEDPLAYVRWKTEQIDKKIDQSSKADEERAKYEAMRADLARRNEVIVRQEAEYLDSEKLSDDDYESALEFAKKAYFGFQIRGRDINDPEVKRYIDATTFQWAAQQVEAGINPAQAIVEYAKELGWKPNGVAEEKKETTVGGKKVEAFKKDPKVSASSSLSRMPGKSPAAGKMTLDDLDEMSSQEFAAFRAKLEKAGSWEHFWETINIKGEARFA